MREYIWYVVKRRVTNRTTLIKWILERGHYNRVFITNVEFCVLGTWSGGAISRKSSVVIMDLEGEEENIKQLIKELNERGIVMKEVVADE